MTRQAAQEAMQEAIRKWNEIYDMAIQVGPHNPAGTAERAEELTRAYMNGMLMRA